MLAILDTLTTHQSRNTRIYLKNKCCEHAILYSVFIESIGNNVFPYVDIFNVLNKEQQCKNIGVLVSGPQSMQKDVARECQKHTRVYCRDATSNVFHYHSVSFDLWKIFVSHHFAWLELPSIVRLKLLRQQMNVHIIDLIAIPWGPGWKRVWEGNFSLEWCITTLWSLNQHCARSLMQHGFIL